MLLPLALFSVDFIRATIVVHTTALLPTFLSPLSPSLVIPLIKRKVNREGRPINKEKDPIYTLLRNLISFINMPPREVIIDGVVYGMSDTITELNVREGITSIPDRCCEDCGNLTTVILPSSLLSIGHESFDGCKSLRNISA